MGQQEVNIGPYVSHLGALVAYVATLLAVRGETWHPRPGEPWWKSITRQGWAAAATATIGLVLSMASIINADESAAELEDKVAAANQKLDDVLTKQLPRVSEELASIVTTASAIQGDLQRASSTVGAIKNDLPILATSEQLKSLATQVRKLATSEQVRSLATTEDMKRLATSEQVRSLATTEDVKHLATMEQVKRLATSEALKMLATSDQVRFLATSEQVQRLATSEQVQRLATSEDLERLATSEQVQRLPTGEDLKGLATSEDVRRLRVQLQEGSVKTQAGVVP